MKTGLRTKILIYFGLLAVISVSNLGLLYKAEHDEDLQQDWVLHTFQVMNEAERLLGHLRDAETGQRGYLLTGELAYLQPYEKGAAGVQKQLQKLQYLTEDNPEQQSRLKLIGTLVDRKLSELGTTVQLMGDEKQLQAMSIVRSGQGKGIMDSLRGYLEEFEDEERRLLELRESEFEKKKLILGVLFFVEVLLLIVLIWLVNFLIQRNLVNPILLLKNNVESMANGRDLEEVRVLNDDEIGGLTKAFNQMHREVCDRSSELSQKAHFDSLTKLPNRFLSLDRLSQSLSEAQRSQTLVAVLFLDLDDFKKINDSLGHEAGDRLLLEAGERLGSVVRVGDTVGRLGGDEFIVLLGGLKESTNASHVAENLLDQFRAPFKIDGRELMLTASIGIAMYPDDGMNSSELLRNADSAMYHSKDLGRNTYSYFTEAMNREVSRRLELEEQIHGALARGEFSIAYQPQIDIDSGRINGAEALLRWSNPVLGNVSPMEFIPIAEQTGLIVPIGQYVLLEALSLVRHVHQTFDPEFRISVNLSPRQFQDPDLAGFIVNGLRQSSVTGKYLSLEITEGVLMTGHRDVQDAFTKFVDLGIGISMDDFGTGYSSLSYLRRYPFSSLKIDRSFVNDIATSSAGRELIKATVAMAHVLNLNVVAEGVETDEQLTFLKFLGCDNAQGYLLSKPLPEERLFKLLEQSEIPGCAAQASNS